MLYRIPDVEIFATGHYRDRDWTAADLQQIHGNFAKFSVPAREGESPYLRVPVVLGHEEDQPALQRSDLPALAWVDGMRLTPEGSDAKLVSNLDDMVPELADWIKQGKIRNVSAEFFEDFIDDAGNHHGLTLRRLAVLGGTVPQVKKLNELPTPVAKFAEGQKTLTVVRIFKFAEGSGMNRDQMMELVKGSKVPFSPEFLDGLSDEQLAQLIQSLAPKTPDEKPADPPADPAADPTKMADPAPAVNPTPSPAAPAIPSGNPSQIVLKYGDVQPYIDAAVKKALAPLSAKVTAVDRQATDRLNADKKSRIKTFLDEQVKAGKVLPAERPHIEARLLRADAVNRVHKFADGAETLSELDAQMKEIEARPVILKFGELMPQSETPGTKLSKDRREKLLSSSAVGRTILKKEKIAN